MANSEHDPSAEALGLVALMRTGVDPMTSYDYSIPIDPISYDPHRPFRNRISMDDARSVGISDAYESFEGNRFQLICLAHLPAEAFLYALRFQKLRQEVQQGNVPGPEVAHFPKDHPHSLFSSLSQAMRDCMDGKREFPSLSEEELAPYYHVAGVARLGNPQYIGPSIKAFAVSILTQSWQAYEVLAEDLLNDAISNNPSKFPSIVPPIEIFGLDRGDKSIRASYERTFGDSEIHIKGVLADQHLDYVFAIRNLFAHKAGKTDQRYLDKVKKLTLSKIKRPNIDEDFPLTGGMVNELGDHCFVVGYSLLREVYMWLNNNQ
jgi:hypothetical protein